MYSTGEILVIYRAGTIGVIGGALSRLFENVILGLYWKFHNMLFFVFRF